jgi:hypothetical protein
MGDATDTLIQEEWSISTLSDFLFLHFYVMQARPTGGTTHIHGGSFPTMNCSPAGHCSLQTPSQTHPEVCFTNPLGISQSNQVNNQTTITDVPSKYQNLIRKSALFYTMNSSMWQLLSVQYVFFPGPPLF